MNFQSDGVSSFANVIINPIPNNIAITIFIFRFNFVILTFFSAYSPIQISCFLTSFPFNYILLVYHLYFHKAILIIKKRYYDYSNVSNYFINLVLYSYLKNLNTLDYNVSHF